MALPDHAAFCGRHWQQSQAPRLARAYVSAVAALQLTLQVPVHRLQQRQARQKARERDLQAVSALHHQRQVAGHFRLAHCLREQQLTTLPMWTLWENTGVTLRRPAALHQVDTRGLTAQCSSIASAEYPECGSVACSERRRKVLYLVDDDVAHALRWHKVAAVAAPKP